MWRDGYKQPAHVFQASLGLSLFFSTPFFFIPCTVGVESVACDAFRDFSQRSFFVFFLLMPRLQRLLQQPSHGGFVGNTFDER